MAASTGRIKGKKPLEIIWNNYNMAITALALLQFLSRSLLERRVSKPSFLPSVVIKEPMRSIKKSLFFNQINRPDRLCALTDGVYAIVLTLLVLDLKLPETPGLSEAKIIDDLVKQIPNFFSYVISFFVVAGLWIKHHIAIKPLTKCNERTFGLNLVHLLFVTLTPYTASLFGHYKEDPIVVLLFSGSIGLAAFSLHILHWHVVAKPEWYGEDAPEEWKHPNWLFAYPASIIALVSMSLAFISVTGAILVWVIFPLSLFAFTLLSRKPT